MKNGKDKNSEVVRKAALRGVLRALDGIDKFVVELPEGWRRFRGRIMQIRSELELTTRLLSSPPKEIEHDRRCGIYRNGGCDCVP